jgi:hypothetical protein
MLLGLPDKKPKESFEMTYRQNWQLRAVVLAETIFPARGRNPNF